MDLNIDYKALILPPDATVRQAMQVMTDTGLGFVMIAGPCRLLAGVLADSDIRKALLRGAQLGDAVSLFMTSRPLVAPAGAPRELIQSLFHKHGKSCIPLVGSRNEILGIALIAEYLLQDPAPRDAKVVVMAGGRGKRLQPLTDTVPKPMVPVGGKPLLEHIVERLSAAGFHDLVFSVNYLADQVIGHFQDGGRWNVRIEYIHEPQSSGTAGYLSLLKSPTNTLIVMNADLLTNLNFGFLVDYHRQEKALATACVRQYAMQVPFGVVDMNEHKLQEIKEKPTLQFFVNAGIYVLQAEVLQWIPPNSHYDMPTLLADVNRRRPGSVSCFPVQEYWLDIGRKQDYAQAQQDYEEVFRA